MKTIEAKFAKPKKKIKRTTLVNKADKLFSPMVRAKGYCELAGKDTINCGGGLQCAHIETRGAHAIRWSFENALCLCAGHHVYYTNHPRFWDLIVEEVFPDKWNWVEEHRRDTWDKDLEKVLEKLLALNG